VILPGDFSMPSPARSTASFRSVLRRFCRNRRGSAAVEFSMVALPFFALLFAIIETAIVFFASQILETGIQDAGRQLYTHQLQDKNLSEADAKKSFEKDLCERVKVLFGCSDSAPIAVDVRSYLPNATITIADPIAAGNYDPAAVVFQKLPSCGPATIVVRGFYQWPLFVTGLGYNIANVSGSKRLLAATAAFRVEPC
jgi:Flp pilus assembly protein TadG